MFKYFTLEEFACQETGENEISEEFVHALDALRHEAGFPFDIAVSGGVQRYLLVAAAIKLGFSGIGVAKGFVHVDTRTSARVIWVY
jgi:hypothetical protein